LSAPAATHLFGGESFDDRYATDHEGPECGTKFGDDNSLITVRNGDLFARWQRHARTRTITGRSRTAVIVRRMRLLITNDDGVDAPGLHALVRAVDAWIERAPTGSVREAVVLAPLTNQSGMSSAVGDVFGRSGVAYRQYDMPDVQHILAYGLEATPALCVIIGVLGGVHDRPDVILSGINAGANVGRSVLHSGTVGAILTGAQLGLSGLAVSVQHGEDIHFDTAGHVAAEVLDLLEHAPAGTLLNLNVPNLPGPQLRGVRRGRISTAGLIKGAGPGAGGSPLGREGVLPLRLGAASPQLDDVSDDEPEDDGALVVAGFASLTPLRGAHEDTNPAMDDLVRQALAAIDTHLEAVR
jgi:5'-nucleotidase